MQFNGSATEHFAAFDCVVVPDCVFIIRLSLLRRTLTTWSADREGWLNGKLCVLLFFLCNHTDDLLSCLACARPVYLCLVCDWLHFKLYSTFLVFCRVAVPVYFKCPPYNILPVTFIHFFSFLAVVLGINCWFYFIILFVPTQYIFLANTFVLNHC